MKKILMVLLFIFTTLPVSKAKVNYIYGFEGLWQGRKASVYNLIDSLDTKAKVEVFAHYDKPKNLVHGQTLFIGHSLGGETVLKLAQEGDYVITLDPRPNNIGSIFDSIFRFEQPFTVPKTFTVYNFFRRGPFLPGQRVINGTNTEFKPTVSHMQVPFQPEVKKKIEELLNK